MREDIYKKITKARAGLILDHPFWGSLSLKPELIEDGSCKVGWTDGVKIGYNPDAMEKFTLAQVKTFIAHEAGGHIGLSHHTRMGNRDKRKFNIAADHVVNNILNDCGFEPIDGWLCDPRYKGMSVEQVYSMLPDEPESNDKGKDNDPGGTGEVREYPGKDGGKASPSEIAQAEAEVKVATAQAYAIAKKMGKVPGSLERMVEDLLEAKVPWKEVLRRFIDEIAKNDFTWVRLNRKYLSSGFYLPSLYNQEMRPLVIAVDTSGSVQVDEINQFAAEVSDIVDELKVDVTVMYCNVRVTRVEEFTPENLPLKLNPIGGGGTSFIPPFLEVDKMGLDPSCLIYLTDGACSRFPESPNYPVLWGIIGHRKVRPPFGEVIYLE